MILFVDTVGTKRRYLEVHLPSDNIMIWVGAYGVTWADMIDNTSSIDGYFL